MRLLLDTHIALWSVANSPLLSNTARDLITAPVNECHVSVISLWEIAIKFALQRRGGDIVGLSAKEAHREFGDAGFQFVPVEVRHAEAVGDLPTLHRDPFDRLLVAQALSEPLRLVTHDAKLAAYSDTVILV